MSSEEAKPSPTPESPSDQQTVVEKPKKEKKPRTPAQIAATAKGLEALTKARKERAEKQRAVKEEVKEAKKAVERKILSGDNGFVSRREFDELQAMLKSVVEAKVSEPKVIEKVIEKPVDRIVERIIEKPVAVVPERKLTGTALLDKLFFEKW